MTGVTTGTNLTRAQKEVARYVKAFGERGGRMFAEGVSFEDAHGIVAAELNETIRRQQEKIDRLLSSADEVVPPELSESGGGAKLFGQS